MSVVPSFATFMMLKVMHKVMHVDMLALGAMVFSILALNH